MGQDKSKRRSLGNENVAAAAARMEAANNQGVKDLQTLVGAIEALREENEELAAEVAKLTADHEREVSTLKAKHARDFNEVAGKHNALVGRINQLRALSGDAPMQTVEIARG